MIPPTTPDEDISIQNYNTSKNVTLFCVGKYFCYSGQSFLFSLYRQTEWTVNIKQRMLHEFSPITILKDRNIAHSFMGI